LPEVRIDPLSGHKTIIAGARARRPGGEPWCSAPKPIDPDADPFAEGHEDRTPPEICAVRPRGGAPNSPGWTVRVVPNLFPALEPVASDGEIAARTAAFVQAGELATRGAATGSARRGEASARGDLFASMLATGAHEVIINAPAEVSSLADVSAAQVASAMDVWRSRMREHADSAYVQLIVNERQEAGASLPHTHAQLYAFDFVPAAVARERERFHAYATRTMGSNLLVDLVAEEVRLRERLIAVDDEAVLVAPYASRLPFQLMLAPRRPRARFEHDGPLCAAMLHKGLRLLARHLGSSPPLNLWVRTAPAGAEQFCWRIDIMPRLAHLAGLELSTGLTLNIVAPEQAAMLLREV
jgi:UDPglucose--hexose-1-phosphate uridylyltransferase